MLLTYPEESESNVCGVHLILKCNIYKRIGKIVTPAFDPCYFLLIEINNGLM